ncbi:hypothetical protein [Mesorhizobium sp. M2A.F.Ca.ET.067.02.1.1]|uniref:hypothetical protein n=1 Tax=Mesorhizobium sp. M2A.F.Ca.ET.067.02.1.1 TaxID=2496749 RepID=UPI000FEBF208|nr:hypothetical protein [Mesorhizobium sp. M2A.F.Ca.ET.067.02.1.1]
MDLEADELPDHQADRFPTCRCESLDIEPAVIPAAALANHPVGKRVDIDIAKDLNEVGRLIVVEALAIATAHAHQAHGVIER